MPQCQIEFSDHFHPIASLPFGEMVCWYLFEFQKEPQHVVVQEKCYNNQNITCLYLVGVSASSY
jgi:hypothetical protein